MHIISIHSKPHVPHACALNLGFRTAWVIGIRRTLGRLPPHRTFFLVFKYKTLAAEQDRADSIGFKISKRIKLDVRYASDPRFKIQGAREHFALQLES